MTTTNDPDQSARLQRQFEAALMDVALIEASNDETYLEMRQRTDNLRRIIGRLGRAAGVEIPEYRTERKVVRSA